MPAPLEAPAPTVSEALAALWQEAGLGPLPPARLHLSGRGAGLPSSFALGTALHSAVAAAALAASEVAVARGAAPAAVSVAQDDVLAECSARFSQDGITPPAWDKLSGLYRCGEAAGTPGWVRIHANFAHHRDAALRVLHLPAGPATGREAVAAALHGWAAEAFEQAVNDAGGATAAVRTQAQWLAHPQAAEVAARPLVAFTKLGEHAARPWPAAPTPWPAHQPLRGLRVLDLTRILAGPVAGRTLAAYGADVMLVNSPRLPNIEHIADTSRGKRSVHIDLATAAGRDTLRALVRECDVFMQGYRPGALESLGFGPQALAALRPGLVVLSLSAYGDTGPWAGRRGFDSLVQSATGLNAEEAAAFGSAEPRAFPLQALDYGAGFLLAFAASAALLRQRREGGSWHAQVALARVGQWVRDLGRVSEGPQQPPFNPGSPSVEEPSGFGLLRVFPHAARFDGAVARGRLPAMPPGSHPPRWEG